MVSVSRRREPATGEQAALDRVLHRKLQPASYGLACLYLILAGAHLVCLEGRARTVLMLVALASSGIGFLGARALKRGIIEERHAHPAGFALCLIVLVNSLVHLVLAGDAHQTTNVMLALIIGGSLLLTLRWWALLSAVAVAGWVGCMAAVKPNADETLHFAFALVFSIFVSGLMTRVLRDLTVETEIRFRELSESIREVFWIAEPAMRRILYVSPAYARIWGQSPERALADVANHLERVHPEDLPKVRSVMEEQGNGGETRLEFRVVDVDGTVRWLEDRAYPVRDRRGHLVRMNGLTRDITEAKRVQEEREMVERRLAETQRMESLAVLAGGVAHDFNNLLMVVLGNANLARQEATPDSPLDRRLAQIERTAIRAGDLCRQMLAYAGQGRIECQLLQINDAVREMADLLEASVSKKVVLEFRLAPLVPSILADPTQIQQILLNLVVNASEAMGERGGIIEVSTSVQRIEVGFRSDAKPVTEHPPGDYVTLAVADTGHGMEPAVAERVFEPFFSTKFAGRGLGLAAVLGIVRSHGGAIRVESRVGVGSTFRVFFPVHGRSISAGSGSADGTVQAPSWSGAGRALVVDDQEHVRQLVVTHLAQMGFQTDVAKDGPEALAKLGRSLPDGFDVILLDWSMPGMDGADVLQCIEALATGTRVILMSGYDTVEIAGGLGRPRPVRTLQKPFTKETLLAAVKTVFEEDPR